MLLFSSLHRVNQLTQHSQDIIFGSEGTAQADNERMEEINAEIGLTRFLQGGSGAIQGAANGSDTGYDAEKGKSEHYSRHV